MALRRRSFMAGLAIVAAPSVAHAQGAPPVARAQGAPLRLVLGFGPGGTLDVVARALAPDLAALLARPIVIDYVNGASGTRAANAVATAERGTDTLLFGTSSLANTTDPVIRQSRARELIPILVAARSPMVVATRPGLDCADLAGFGAMLRASGRLTYASSGAGSATHLAVVELLTGIGAAALHVPFAHAGQVVANMAGGHVDFGILGAVNLMGGPPGLANLGSTTRQRPALPVLAELPTVSETLLPGFHWDVWQALLAPPHAPEAWRADVAAAANAALASPALRATLARAMCEPVGGDAAAARDIFATESARFERLSHAAG
ncbi:tripartite tricarboxylate transporter substrate binding protein [Roseomonas sp. CECT 9278]|uniref:Bug family tripartite tricarboxylate transporter substrate binding protein n=1 Tax=Roseomonas sp. CECT 9278 TaxID=2845823 RepID=UPI001E3C60FE|nr:tripartite tricarboxylate transporter substrate-binding protein [Roseomonas sp. CECT 9278]